MYGYPTHYYNQPTGGGISCLGCLFSAGVLFLAFSVLAVFVLVMVGIGLVIYLIVRWLFKPQPRLFEAYPMSRWSDAYEHGLDFLETRSGVDFNSTPLRILSGSLILTLTPLMLLDWVIPGTLGFLPWVGLVLAFSTAWVLSNTSMVFRSLPEPLSIRDLLPSDDGLPLPPDFFG